MKIDKIMNMIEGVYMGNWGQDMLSIKRIIEKFITKEEHICEKHIMDSNCPVCGMFVAGMNHNEAMEKLLNKFTQREACNEECLNGFNVMRYPGLNLDYCIKHDRRVSKEYNQKGYKEYSGKGHIWGGILFNFFNDKWTKNEWIAGKLFIKGKLVGTIIHNDDEKLHIDNKKSMDGMVPFKIRMPMYSSTPTIDICKNK